MHSGDRKELESKSVAEFERLWQQMRSKTNSPERKQVLKDFLSQQSPDTIANILKRSYRKTVRKVHGLSILVKLYEPSEAKQFSDILNKIPDRQVPEVMSATLSSFLGDKSDPIVAYKRWIRAIEKFGYCAIQPFICKAVQPIQMFGKTTSHKESFNSLCFRYIDIRSDRAGLEKLVEVVEPYELVQENKHVQDLLCNINMALYQKLINKLGHFGFGKILISIAMRLNKYERDEDDRSPSIAHSYLNKDSDAKVSSVLQKYFPEKYKPLESKGITFFPGSKGDSKGDSKADSKQERKHSAESSLSLDDDEFSMGKLAWTDEDELSFFKMRNLLLSEWLMSEMKQLDSIFNEVKRPNQNLLALRRQLEGLDLTEKDDVAAFIHKLPEYLQQYKIEEPTKTKIISILSDLSGTFVLIKNEEAVIEQLEAKQSRSSSRP